MNPTAGIDLAQFHPAFFDEAGENLQHMEQLLLRSDIESADDETLNAVFRCAHSIKGGAASFGFGDVAELTHQTETLLDRLRRHELAPSAAMLELLLQAVDALRLQLARHQGRGGEAPDTTALRAGLRSLAGAGGGPPGSRLLQLTVGPPPDSGAIDGLIELFTEITDLGRIEALDGGQAVDGVRRFKVATTSSDADLLELFAFHADAALLRLEPLAPAPPAAAQRAAVAGDSSSLRVPVDKVDQLLNLAGELVITQASLAQRCAALAPAAQQQLAAGLAELQRHTRSLQEAVMSIRMIPMSVVFNRFPRLLRDLQAQLGKKIELRTEGEATELDKGLIEKIIDPLTHLVRNACDHGIELPAERAACGKPETGTVTLAAAHQGGSIVIEVRDDGRGLARDKLLAKARERGLHAPDSLGDAEVWGLIFAPGFSTAAAVTEVSGRGVGMDVVKSNIDALGGTVEIDAAAGRGLCVRVRLPLTLAIMDSMSVRVADECYVLPLAAVVESFQAQPGQLKTLGPQAQLVRLREDFLPLLELRRVFALPPGDGEGARPLLVVVEADGVRVALRVDELLGQQQVVVKNLEANYTPVADIAGATILGDGRVALILDVAALVRRAHG